MATAADITKVLVYLSFYFVKSYVRPATQHGRDVSWLEESNLENFAMDIGILGESNVQSASQRQENS